MIMEKRLRLRGVCIDGFREKKPIGCEVFYDRNAEGSLGAFILKFFVDINGWPRYSFECPCMRKLRCTTSFRPFAMKAFFILFY